MFQKIRRNSYLCFLMTVSFFGVFLVGMLASHPSTMQNEDFLWRKTIIGSIFGLICVLGILAAFHPNCLRIIKLGKEEKHEPSIFRQSSFAVHGHHPNCGKFSTHTFQIGNKMFCASCMGLLFGAVTSLLGIVAYFFNGWHIGQGSLFLIIAGILGVVFGLLQFPLLKNRRSFLRFFLNAFFVLGTFLILIGIDTLVRSLSVDLFLVVLSVFWLFTRISLSQWDHERICQACDFACEFYRLDKMGFWSASGASEYTNDYHYSEGNCYEWP